MTVYSADEQTVVAYGSSWIPLYHLGLIANNWSKNQIRIPIDPENFGNENFGQQPIRVGKSFLVQEIHPHKRDHKLKVVDTFVQRLQSINHYEVLKEFCPNSFESEKMRASFTGSTYQCEWCQKTWDEYYSDQPELHWDKNPLVLVIEFERL